MKVNSKFLLHINTTLSSADYKVLTLLYQPLIGINSYAIYSTFYHLVKIKDKFNHQFLFDLLNITQEEFLSSLAKLEALGLVETYEKNESEYVYVIKPPYSAKKFLSETFLGTYLESEIGTKNLNELIAMFKLEKPKLNDYKNITKTFDDVYKVSTRKLLTISDELEGKNGVSDPVIRDSIDYNIFIERLPRQLKSPILFNDNFKNKIMQIAFVYQFDIEQLVEIYKKASQGNDYPTIEQVNLQAKIYYEKLNEKVVINKKTVSENDAVTNLPFKTVVEKFGKNDPMLRADALSTINEFINQNDIDLGVLNVLVIFILKYKDGVLPPVNYLNKVWQSWMSAGVRTVEDALKYKEQVEKSWTSNRPKINKPEWLDEYIKELENMEAINDPRRNEKKNQRK